jgi:ribonuclease R
MRSNRRFRIGDKVRIKVVAANLEKRHLDYEWVLTTAVEDNEEVQPDVQKAKPKPKQQTKPRTKDKKKKTEE